jgi:hypothetical protein
VRYVVPTRRRRDQDANQHPDPYGIFLFARWVKQLGEVTLPERICSKGRIVVNIVSLYFPQQTVARGLAEFCCARWCTHRKQQTNRLVEALKMKAFGSVQYALVNRDPQLAEKPFEERARLCYLWDKEFIQQADLVIAEASFPSTCIGIELQISENKGIPVLSGLPSSPRQGQT